MRNQAPQPLGGRRAKPPTPAPTEQPAQVAGSEVGHIAAQQPKPAAPNSPPTSPASSPPATAGNNVGEMIKRLPRMAVFFFMPEDYSLFEQAAELDGMEVRDWITDALCELAEARVNYDEKVQSSVDAYTDNRDQETTTG